MRVNLTMEGKQIKALSINQPFGWAIVEGFKDIENRNWSTKYRGEFYIHVGLNVQTSAYPMIRDLTGSPFDKSMRMRIGGIIGIAEIVDCVSRSDSPWFFGRYGFVIKNARRVPFQECKGALGFFTPDFESRYKNRKAKAV